MPDPQPSPRTPLLRWSVACALGLASFALYLFTFATGMDGVILGNDVIPYSEAVASGAAERVLSPHHPGYHLAAYALLLVTGGAGPNDALGMLRWISSLGGALSVVVLFRLALPLGGVRSATALSLLFAFSAGPWLYSAVGESYMPGTAAVGLCLADGVAVRLGWRRANAWRSGALLLLALLVRQDSVLIAPCLALALPWRSFLGAVGGAGLASLGIYAVLWQLSGSDAGLTVWLRGLAETGLWGEGFSAYRFAVTLALTQHALNYGLAWGGVWAALSIATTCLLIAGTCLHRGSRVPVAGSRTAAALFLGSVVLVRIVFFTWWQPSNMEYHTPTLWPLLALTALALPVAGSPAAARAALALFAAALLALGVNGGRLMQPNRTFDMDRTAEEALLLAGPRGLVLSIDRLQHYAQMRARARLAFAAELPLAACLDASDGAGQAGVHSIEALIREARAALARGDQVVVVRDRFLFPRLDLPQVKGAPELLRPLSELGTFLIVEDVTGHPYMTVLSAGEESE